MVVFYSFFFFYCEEGEDSLRFQCPAHHGQYTQSGYAGRTAITEKHTKHSN